MWSFQVFLFAIRPKGSEQDWERRLVAAQSRIQARRALELENMECRGDFLSCQSVSREKRRVFGAIEKGLRRARTQLEWWRDAGFPYVVKRRDQSMVPLPLTLSAEDLRREEGAIVYSLRMGDEFFLACIRLSYDEFRRQHPLRSPHPQSQAAE
jgi:hypothetical protein